MTNYIGIDVGKKLLHVYMPLYHQSFEVPNNQQGLTNFLSYCVQHYQDLSNIIVVFKPTGGYERNLKKFLKILLSYPNKVRAYAKARGLLAKNDRIDSKLLAEYAKAFSLKSKQEYRSQGQEHLQALIQRRE